MAVSAALVVLGYFEMPKEDVPDESIWGHPARLEEWFEAVEQRRNSGMVPIDEEPQDMEMTSNSLLDDLRE